MYANKQALSAGASLHTDQRPDNTFAAQDQGRASAATAPRPPLMAELGKRVAVINDVLGGGCADLNDLRNRVFGPWPSTGEAQTAAPESQVEELFRQLDVTFALASQIRENAASLNSTI